MAVVGVTNISELKGARRLDAEYYQPAYLKLEKEILKISSKRLKNIAFVTDGIHSSIDYDPTSQIRIISAQSVQDNDFDLSANTRISVEQHQRNLRTSLEVGDIIISSVGTIGNAAVVSANMLPSNADRHVGIVRLKNKKFNAFHVSTFLNSKYGRFQTFRESTGNVQLNLFIEKIEELLIPEIEDAEQIGKVTEQATILLEDSRNLYSQAENLLLEKLGLKDFKPKYELSYTANLAEAFEARRIDAEYFQPAYDQVAKRVSEYQNGYTALLGCVEAVRADFDPIRYPDSSFRYVELADIDASIGVIHSAGEVKGDEAPSRARRVLKRGDILVSSVEGSLDKVALVDEEREDSLASTGFFQFRAGTIRPEVLLVLSKSIILQAQLKRECAGTILTAVPNESLKRILVPVLPPEFQQKITSLVRESHEARRKARELLEEAKSRVEQAIENYQR